MTLAITVLGSSGMFPTQERAASGYLLHVGTSTIWVDAGGGTWRNLLGLVDYHSIDGVLLTHRHPDHTVDFFMGYHARMYGDAEPLEPIPLWAPAEAIAALRAFVPDLPKSFDCTPIDADSTFEIEDAEVSFTKMAHPPQTVGMRVQQGKSVIAYTADSGPSADFGRLAQGAGLFICEATLQDSDELWWGHLSASQAGGLARDLGVPKLLLTHLPPGRDLSRSLDEARREGGDVDVELAYDAQRVEVT